MILDETLKDGEMRIYTDLGNGWVEEKETINIRQYGKTYQMIKEQQEEIERLNNIIEELEKWLKEKQTLYGINQQGFSWGVCGDALEYLKELKEGK